MFALPTFDRPTATTERQTTRMKRPLSHPQALEALLRPETALEKLLINTPEFHHGLLWGEPRFGHPEGKVAYHIREVFENIDRIPNISRFDRGRLRLIALIHDTFKFAEDRSRPRDWSKHHGILARQFFEHFTDDQLMLDIIETHDDAYYAWLGTRHEQFMLENSHKSIDFLLERIGPNLQLYYLFFKCDTQTGDKTQAPLVWFESHVTGIEVVRIREV